MADLSSPSRQAPRRRTRVRRAPRKPAASRLAGLLIQRLEGKATVVSASLLGISLVGSVLAIGSVHVLAVLVICPIAIASGAVALWGQRASWRDVPPPALLAFALALFSALQAVPLPAGVVRLLGPTNVDVWASAWKHLGLGSPSMTPISLDPGASLVEALKWTSYAAAFCAAAHVARRRSLLVVSAMVFGAAVAVAVVTLAHRAGGATAVYGLYTPEFAHPSFALSPLLNANHLSGYMNLGAFAGLSFVVSRQERVTTWLAAGGVSLVVAIGFLATSRGGSASLLAGMVLLVALLLVSKADAEGRGRAALVLLPLAAIFGGLALFALGADADVFRTLKDESLKKIELIRWSGPLISDHRFIGVGRGAFGTTMPAYRKDLGHHVYAHAENFVAQWMSEWGVVVALAAMLGFAWMLRPRRIGLFRSRAATAVTVGVVVLLAQNLVDFALEVASVSLALSAALGALWGAARRERAGSRSESPLRAPVIALSAAGVTLLASATAWGYKTALAERRTLGAAVEGTVSFDRDARDRLMADIGSAMRRHPGDPYLPYLGGVVALRSRGNAIPWIAHALERDPMEGGPHLLLAYALASRRAHGQARLAIRLAIERDFYLAEKGLALATKMGATPDELLECAPSGEPGAAVLVAFARHLAVDEQRGTRARLLDEAIARSPAIVSAHAMRVEDLLDDLESGATDCAATRHDACVERASEIAGEIASLAPDSDRATVYRARIALVEDEPARADAILAQGCPVSPSAQCWRWRIIAGEQVDPRPPLDDARRAYLEAACTNRTACAAAATWIGDRLARSEDWAGATTMYERAARESGDAKAWKRLAAAATRAGVDSVALRALERARAAERTQKGEPSR